MNALIAIALKSLLVAAVTLFALRLARRRSAAERSWIAHVGLLAIVILPLAPLALPQLSIEAGALVAPQPADQGGTEARTVASAQSAPASSADSEGAAPSTGWSAMEVSSFLYWIPTLLLLSITLIALARLVALRSRAEVLVDSHWLSALARAQKRMGFKHGTALLTSNDLPSPISWGLMRPVILLNDRAVDAAEDAEAIIAHELAHVARLDWLKLLLARVATALFWFNPLVWIIAREAHQLREEAADDTVLAANIEDTDYAQLLVGVARHECRGLLIGAHGVAPSRASLARRVARVLDNRSPRAPVGRSFALGVFFGAVATATPLAALTFVPAGSGDALNRQVAQSEPSSGYYPAGGVPLPEVVSKPVSQAIDTAVAEAVAAVDPRWADELRAMAATQQVEANDAAKDSDAAIASAAAATISVRQATQHIGPIPGTVGPRPGTVGPQGLYRPDPVDEVIALKAVGATPEYARAIRSAAPQLANVGAGELTSLKALGVTPAYIQELARAGQTRLDAKSVMELRALGVSGDYIRSMAAAGYPNLSAGMLAQMKAMGVNADLVRRYRQQGLPRMTASQLVSMRAVDLRGPAHHGRGHANAAGGRDEDSDIDIDVDVDDDS